MKNFVTVLLTTSVLALGGTSLSQAQSVNTSPILVAPNGPTPSGVYHAGPGVATGSVLIHKGFSPMAVTEDSESNYVDDGTYTTWPVGDTIKDSTGAPRVTVDGSPFIRFLAQESFTLPEAKPVLDSIRLVFVADTLGSEAGNHFVLQFFTQTERQLTNGTMYPFANLNAPPMRTINISTAKINLHQIVDTVIHFRPGITVNMSDTLGADAGNVFASLSSYYPDNRLRMLADSNNEPVRDLDPTIDRAYWVAFSADNKYYLPGIWSGVYYTGQDQQSVFYQNFIMTLWNHDGSAGVSDGPVTEFTLGQNYPNSFSSKTSISYSLKNSSPVLLKVYNTMGDEVASLVDGPVGAGTHNVAFDGSTLPSGTYFYTMRAAGQSMTRSMVISR